MHTSGKVLVWVIVVLALAAIYFSARGLKTQRNWQTKVDDLRAKVEKNDESLAAERREFSEFQQELSRLMLPWERYWSKVPVELADPKVGDLRVAIGTAQGLGAPINPERPRPVVHGFRPLGDGKYVYVGPFYAIDIRETASTLRPVWRLRATDVAHFQKPTDEWRFRALIPSAREERFRSLEKDLATADEAAVAKLNYVKAQVELIKLAQEHYGLRLRELLGSAEQPKDVPGDEYVIGLQAAVANAEDGRDAVLADVDRLRNQLHDRYAQSQQLAAQNNELTARLPHNGEAAAASVTAR